MVTLPRKIPAAERAATANARTLRQAAGKRDNVKVRRGIRDDARFIVSRDGSATSSTRKGRNRVISEESIDDPSSPPTSDLRGLLLAR